METLRYTYKQERKNIQRTNVTDNWTDSPIVHRINQWTNEQTNKTYKQIDKKTQTGGQTNEKTTGYIGHTNRWMSNLRSNARTNRPTK